MKYRLSIDGDTLLKTGIVELSMDGRTVVRLKLATVEPIDVPSILDLLPIISTLQRERRNG